MSELKLLRVLNVEDSERDSRLIQRHLTKAGYSLVLERVETAAAMKAALETKQWDVILADFSMPEFSAMKAIEVLKQSGLDIPLIVISGTIGEELAVEAMRSGATDYLMKDKLARLVSAIDRELDEVRERKARRIAEGEMTRLLSEIQRQRDRLNTIIASVPGIVWESWGKPDASTQRIDFVSDYVQKMLGYSIEEWLATPNFWLTIVHPNDRYTTAIKTAVCFAEKRPGTQTFRWIAKDGSVLWVEANFVVVVDESGEAIGMRGVTIDISERMQAEATMRESEERFRKYFELGLVGMVITSLEKGLLEVNDEFCSMLGYERRELLQKTWVELTHPDDRNESVAQFNRVLAAETEGYTLEKRFVHKTGRNVFVRISVKCVRRADGVPSFFVALMQDITESRRAEEELRNSEERYRQLFESNPDPTFVFDQETLQFVAVNEAATAEYGYSRKELLSLTASAIWKPRDVPAFKERLEQMPFGPPRGSTWKHVKNDGTVIDVEITRRPLLFAGRPAWVLIAHNVTKRMLLEEQFRQAQKMEAVGQLAGGMAHDFNNLLTVINGYSEFALGRLRAEDPLRNDMEQILRAGERATALTRQLLAFSRKQVLLPTVLDPNSVIANLEKMLRRLIGEDIFLHTDLAPGIGNFKADRGQIEQVLMNLVVNARDAMTTGGHMTIETQNVELIEGHPGDEPNVKTGSYVMLAVTDTGIGMDEQTKAQIFVPFFTTKDSGKGTGLGLSTVYGIVHQSGGSISVDSEVGSGSAFKIFFPRVDSAPQAGEQNLNPVEVSQSTETILLTEDDEMVRALTLKVLSTHGYKVLSAVNGGEALLLCERHTGPIHLLITDVVMPQINGPDLAMRLRQIRHELKVLYMSGYTDKAILHQHVLDENTPFIQKPFAPQTLIRKVREVLDTA